MIEATESRVEVIRTKNGYIIRPHMDKARSGDFSQALVVEGEDPAKVGRAILEMKRSTKESL